MFGAGSASSAIWGARRFNRAAMPVSASLRRSPGNAWYASRSASTAPKSLADCSLAASERSRRTLPNAIW